MIVPPGLSFPSRSAASIIGSPIRSFTEPPGFSISSFARRSGCSPSGPRARPTRGARAGGGGPAPHGPPRWQHPELRGGERLLAERPEVAHDPGDADERRPTDEGEDRLGV